MAVLHKLYRIFQFSSSQGSQPLKRQEKNVSENVVCWSGLLQIIALHYRQIKYRSKQSGTRTGCSYRSSLIWVHTVCHRGFLNLSVDEKSRRLLYTNTRSCNKSLMKNKQRFNGGFWILTSSWRKIWWSLSWRVIRRRRLVRLGTDFPVLGIRSEIKKNIEKF